MNKKKPTDLWGAITDEDAEAVMAAMVPVEEIKNIVEAPKVKKPKEPKERPSFMDDIKDL